MKKISTKSQIKLGVTLSLLLGSFTVQDHAYARSARHRNPIKVVKDFFDKDKNENGTDAVEAYLNESVLSRYGIQMVSMEALTRYDNSPDGKGFLTDGPEIVLEAKLSDRVRAQVRLAFQNLINVDMNHVTHPGDTDRFLDEAKIIIDKDPKSKIPFVTIIGKQEVETGPMDSEMPLDDNEALHGLTRLKGAYAVQFQMGPELIKAIDSIALSAYSTGSGHGDTMGETIMPNAKGGSIVISKKLSEQLTLGGGLTHIAYPTNIDTGSMPENRLNWGLVYTTKSGYKIFFDQASFNYNPLHPNAKQVWTLGVVKHVTENSVVTVQRTEVGTESSEWDLGYTYQVTRKVSVGAEYRNRNSVVNGPSNYIGVGLRYSFEKEGGAE
jgi:hypothetical protein